MSQATQGLLEVNRRERAMVSRNLLDAQEHAHTYSFAHIATQSSQILIKESDSHKAKMP